MNYIWFSLELAQNGLQISKYNNHWDMIKHWLIKTEFD
jgi:hypothetical protein